MFGVGFRSFGCMMRRMMQMALRGVSMMRCRFMIVRLVMRCRFTVMPRRVFVMFCCLVVMLCRLLGHCFLLMNACMDGAAPPYSPSVKNV
jgi:hypothetical protein